MVNTKIFLTSDHNAANVRLSQDVDNFGTLRLYQVLHHQQTQEVHVFLYFPSVEKQLDQQTY